MDRRAFIGFRLKMRDKRREANEKKLQDICKPYGVDRKKIMTKEKYGRFDISWCGVDIHKDMPDKLMELEAESEHMCETCGKLSKQYWDYGGRYTHHCLRHFIILKIRKFFRRLKRKLGVI